MIQVEKTDLLIGQYGAFEPGSLGYSLPYRGNHTIAAYQTPGQSSRATLAVITKGMGAREPSQAGAEAVIKSMLEVFDQASTVDDVPGLLEHGFALAGRFIWQLEKEIGATGAAVAIVDHKLYLATLGDCRVFLVRAGVCTLISVAHTFTQELINRGFLTEEDLLNRASPGPTPVVLRALGQVETIEVDLRLRLAPDETDEQSLANQGMTLVPGDLVLLTDAHKQYVFADDWKLLHNTFCTDENDPQVLVNQFVEGTRQKDYCGDLTVVALKVPDKK